MRPRVLTVAGTDPSGGAGCATDVTVFRWFGCHPLAVVSARTVQDSTRVLSVAAVGGDAIEAQLVAVGSDAPIAAMKTGLLPTADAVDAVVRGWRELGAPPFVLDPVAAAGSGDRLADAAAVRVSVEHLVPLATLVTPNADEAESLTGVRVIDEATAIAAGQALTARGAAAVLVKGGHMAGPLATDVLVRRGVAGGRRFSRRRITTARRVRGTGCALSAAIAACLARNLDLDVAVDLAGQYVHAAIAGAYESGRGALFLDLNVPVPAVPS